MNDHSDHSFDEYLLRFKHFQIMFPTIFLPTFMPFMFISGFITFINDPDDGLFTQLIFSFAFGLTVAFNLHFRSILHMAENVTANHGPTCLELSPFSIGSAINTLILLDEARYIHNI